jgi:tetratricopeptide (TPR) repeat protein
MVRQPVDLSIDELLVQATCAVVINGRIQGTAWLVDNEGHLLTAGHILGVNNPINQVSVQFIEDVPRDAYKVQWGYQQDLGIDFAVLKLSSPAVDRIPLPISLKRKVSGTFGLRGYGITFRDQSAGQGEFIGFFDPQNSPNNRLFQLRSAELGEGGYSGAAVFSEQLQAVVSIQIEATTATTGAGRDTILSMPLYRVAQHWETLLNLEQRQVQQRIEEGLADDIAFGITTTTSGYARRVNVPIDQSPNYFQDRTYQIQSIGDFLDNERKRLLIIRGRAGIGKTILACRAIELLERGQLQGSNQPIHFDHIVELSALGTNAIDVQRLFSNLCGLIRDEAECSRLNYLYQLIGVGIEDKMRELLNALGRMRIVVFLDNFESVMNFENDSIQSDDLNRALTCLLTTQSCVKIILTTRRVPMSLALSNPERVDILELSDDDGLPSPFAEQLLRELDADGRAGLRAADEDLLREARELTRGYPKALVALYAILMLDRDTTLRDILHNPTMLPDNITYALVGEAYSRLDSEAQQVMQALAIYGMPIRPAAIDYLLKPYVSGINSAIVLKRLLNMYMVRKEEAPHEGGGVDRRYYLHPTDRQYALSQVPRGRVEDSDLSNQRPRFTQIALFCRAADYFRKARRSVLQNVDDLAPQLAEIKLCIAGEDYITGARVLFEIDLAYLSRWGKNQDVIDLHERLEAHLPDRIREKSLRHLGRAKMLISDYFNAIVCFEDALRLIRNLPIPASGSEAFCLAYTSWCRHWLGDNDNAVQIAQQAIKILREVENSVEKYQSEIMANGTLAVCSYITGQTLEAIEYAQRAVDITRQHGDRQEESYYLGSFVGVFHSCLGNFEEAIDLYQQALDIAIEIDYRLGQLYHLCNLAETSTYMGRYVEAIEYGYRALKISDEIRNPVSGTWTRGVLALTHLLQNDFSKASTLLKDAAQYDEPMHNSTIEALRGIVFWRRGDHREEAQKAFRRSLDQSEALLQNNSSSIFLLEAKGTALAGLALCGDSSTFMDSAVVTFRKLREITKDRGNIIRSLLILESFVPLELLDDEDPLGEVRSVTGHS